MLQENRKMAREEMLMKRRGLNFVTEHHEELLDQDTIENCEKHLDNVAPRVVGILSLSDAVDTEAIKKQLIRNCLLYTESLKGKKEEKMDVD
jgi:hypothetical protein